MKTVSIYDLRSNLAEYLTMVSESDMSIIIKRFGKAIAKITPYSGTDAPESSEYFGFLGKGKPGQAYLSKVRRSPVDKRRIMEYRGV